MTKVASHPKHPKKHHGHVTHHHGKHHVKHPAHGTKSANTLKSASTRHAVLTSPHLAGGRAAIDKAQSMGNLQAVSLSNLPLDRSYVPHTHDSGMQHRNPGGFRWDAQDQTGNWWPQAVTTSADSNATGMIDGHKWVAATWHSQDGKRSRISFADVTNPNDPSQAKYRHVELMVPDPKHPGKLQPLAKHVGGVSWVGNYLYVADTRGGLRVFDIRELSKVTHPNSVPKGTLPYVLPQVGFYKLTGAAKHHGDTPVFSGLSLDRKHGRLISEEFSHIKGGVIASWPIDLKTGLLKETGGHVRATKDWRSPVKKMAGVLARGDGFDVVEMGKPRSHLHHIDGNGRDHVVDTLWRASQQLSWDSTLNEVWSLGEMRNHRGVWHFKPF